jgi:hypothetical protein
MKRSTRYFSIDDLHQPWARVVSDVLSPPVVWALLAFAIAYHGDSGWSAAFWALLYGTLVCWLPVIYIAWNVRNGRITDVHMKVRRERLRPLMVTLTGTGLAFIALWLAGAPRLMPLFALFTLIQMAILALITLTWQISVHAMTISSAVVATGALYGLAPAAALLPLIPLVGAARYKLRRHTLSQIVAGAALGSCVSLGLFLVA